MHHNVFTWVLIYALYAYAGWVTGQRERTVVVTDVKTDVCSGEPIWICQACGKRSPDKYGNHPDTSQGWDEACVLNAVWCRPATPEERERTGHQWWAANPQPIDRWGREFPSDR